MARMYLCLWAEFGSRSTRSIPTLSDSALMMGRGMSGVRARFDGAVRWY